MISAQEILLDSEESITNYPPKKEQPASVEVKTVTPTSNDFESYAAATVDTLSETILSDAAEGSLRIAITGSAAEIGVSYLIENSPLPNLDTSPIVIVCRSISPSYVFLEQPLEREISLGASFSGYRVSKALTTTQTENWGECVAKWKATYLDGTYDEWYQQFKVVKGRSKYALTSEQLRRDFPTVNWKRFRTNDFQDLLDVGWNALASKLMSRQIRIDRIRSWEVLNWAHSQACYLHLLIQDDNFDSVRFEIMNLQYRETIRELLENSLETWYDKENDDTPRADDHMPAKIGIRLSR